MKPIDNPQVDNYILNKMTTLEIESFEKRLETDVNLATELRERQEVLGVLDNLFDYKSKQQIGAVHKIEMASFRKKKRRIVYIQRFAAAAVFAILAIGIWLFIDNTAPTPEQLFADNYSTYTYQYGSRDVIDNAQNLKNASDLYNNQQYQEAISLFQKSLEQTPTQTELYLTLGSSYLETGEEQAALQQFDYLIKKEDRFFKDEALWFSALIYLKQQDKLKAIELLVQIDSSPNTTKEIYKKAQGLLKDLGGK